MGYCFKILLGLMFSAQLFAVTSLEDVRKILGSEYKVYQIRGFNDFDVKLALIRKISVETIYRKNEDLYVLEYLVAKHMEDRSLRSVYSNVFVGSELHQMKLRAIYENPISRNLNEVPLIFRDPGSNSTARYHEVGYLGKPRRFADLKKFMIEETGFDFSEAPKLNRVQMVGISGVISLNVLVNSYKSVSVKQKRMTSIVTAVVERNTEQLDQLNPADSYLGNSEKISIISGGYEPGFLHNVFSYYEFKVNGKKIESIFYRENVDIRSIDYIYNYNAPKSCNKAMN